MHDWVLWALVGVSVVCVFHLWTQSGGSVMKKLVWSVVMMFPIMGPLFYGAIYDDGLSELDEGMRAAETEMDSEDDVLR
jgi:hypothetical protein